MENREVIIANAMRTAIGNYNGALRNVPSVDLGATVIRGVLAASHLDADKLGSVTLGNVIQAGNRMNPARQASIGAGIPVGVPAMTVNRVCGSGAQAIVNAAQEVQLGLHELVLAGGMENMDRAPYLLEGGRWGYRMGHAQVIDSMLSDGLLDAFSGEHSGWHTEDLAIKYSISREMQDAWAHRSQDRFSRAERAHQFAGEIVPLEVKGRKGNTLFDRDEAPRPDTTIADLARLKPAFRPEGTITAGNAPGLNSGASAMIIADRKRAEKEGLDVLGRLAAYGIAAVEPGMFGIGPVPAIGQALARAGWTLSDVDRFEINEAFATVPLAIMQELGIPEEVVNVEGGAIAHGHAIGATGAVLTTRLLHAMRREGLRRGIVALCIGGGQGIALALEAI